MGEKLNSGEIWSRFDYDRSLESWLIGGIIPTWPYFRLVNYCNLPWLGGSDFAHLWRVGARCGIRRIPGSLLSTNVMVSITYPLVNKQLDPENSQFLMETSLPTPMTARVYVNLPEGIIQLSLELKEDGGPVFDVGPGLATQNPNAWSWDELRIWGASWPFWCLIKYNY